MSIKYVEMYKTTKTGQELDCVVYFDEETNQFTLVGVSENRLATWKSIGVIGDNRRIFMHEGMAFLKGLSDDYNGSMYRSTDVMETDKIPWSKKDGSKEKK